jgi:DNA-binding response OmpR family regulator
MLKVMIAEDDLMMADMLEDVLVAGGYEVCGIARTVDKAVELGERHKPDLAVLDLRLAEGGLGTEIAARLNRQGSLGVLYASGNEGQMGLTKADGEACLGKPYQPQDVVRALKIVEQIIRAGEASQPFPRGFRVLNGSSKSDAVPNSANVGLVEQVKRGPGLGRISGLDDREHAVTDQSENIQIRKPQLCIDTLGCTAPDSAAQNAPPAPQH